MEKENTISIAALRSAVSLLRHESREGIHEKTEAIYQQLEQECPEFIDVMVDLLCTAVNEGRPVTPTELGRAARQQVAIAIWIGRRAKEIEIDAAAGAPTHMRKARRSAG